MVFSCVIVTVGQLVDGADVQNGRKQFVKDVLSALGYSADEQVGEALGQLTEEQLKSFRLVQADDKPEVKLSVREINAVLAKIKAPDERVQYCRYAVKQVYSAHFPAIAGFVRLYIPSGLIAKHSSLHQSVLCIISS